MNGTITAQSGDGYFAIAAKGNISFDGTKLDTVKMAYSPYGLKPIINISIGRKSFMKSKLYEEERK